MDDFLLLEDGQLVGAPTTCSFPDLIIERPVEANDEDDDLGTAEGILFSGALGALCWLVMIFLWLAL